MSFCNSPRNERMPGPITGSPATGLCDRVCIQVKKVFDACIRQAQQDGVEVALHNFNPPNPSGPLTFVSCKSSTTKGVIGGLQIDRLENRPRQARVRADVGIPMQCIYVAHGQEGTAETDLCMPVDIVLCVPEPSIIPFQVEAVVAAVCPEGKINVTSATVDACITLILKIVIETELLVPSYGYCHIPPCQEFENEVCETFFELPLYPGGG